MPDERFDLSYQGLLAPGADPQRARERLTAIFKLSEQGADRLFTGKPVVVKRNVDAATVAQFQKVFAHAGAVLTVTSVLNVDDGPAPPSLLSAEREETADTPVQAGSPLSLAPNYDVLEAGPTAAVPAMDLSYLSLVPGDEWTLEDCQPLPTPIPEPDLSYLSLTPLDPVLEREPDPKLDF